MEENENPIVHLLSGALAGLIADLSVHPMDTIRARLQTRTSNKSVFGTFKQIYLKEGFRTLYKGFGTVALFTVPAHSLYFGAYELSKKLHEPSKNLSEKSHWVYFVSGMWAEVGGSILWVPMDIIKQKLQVQKDGNKMKYRHTYDVVKDIYKMEGIRGFYRGTIAGLLTYCPFVGIYFMLYEEWKKRVSKLYTNRNYDFASYLVGGFVSGAIASAVTNPFDIIKTNLQVFSVREGGHSGIIAAVKSLYAEGGLSAFKRGMSARILWIAPSCSITIASYEQCKRLLS